MNLAAQGVRSGKYRHVFGINKPEKQFQDIKPLTSEKQDMYQQIINL